MITAPSRPGDYVAEEVLRLVQNWDTVRGYKHRPAVLVRCADLEVAVRKLPRVYRYTVFHYGMVGHTHAETAKLLGVSEETARLRWHRALDYLLTLMNGGQLPASSLRENTPG